MTDTTDTLETTDTTEKRTETGTVAVKSTSATADERATLERELTGTWRELFDLFQSLAAPKWADLDVSMAQIKALIAIANAQTAAIGEVAYKLGVSLPTASHLVDKLVQVGLVERAEDQEDRRRTIARLTTRGNDLVRQLRGAHQLGVWTPLLSDDDLAALLRGLRALIGAVRATAATATSEKPTTT